MNNLKKSLISIIIVNWNGKKNTEQCLKSLEKLTTKKPFEVLIVDNGSTDDSVQFIKSYQKKHHNLRSIENKKNMGFAGGNNIGFKHAKGEFILFLNNDTIVEKNFIDPLLKVIMSDEKIAAVQPKIMAYPQKDVIDSIGSYFLWNGFLYHFGHNKKDKKKYNVPAEILSMKGACMLFRKSVLDKIGLFDDDYFAYFEETDLCMRTWLAGYKIIYVPESKIYHMGGESARKLQTAFIQYHSYKNRIFTYLKNFEPATLLKLLPRHIFYCEVASIVYLLTGKLNLCFAIQKAIFWNIINMDKLRRERQYINTKIKKTSEKNFLPKLTKKVRADYFYHLFTDELKGYED